MVISPGLLVEMNSGQSLRSISDSTSPVCSQSQSTPSRSNLNVSLNVSQDRIHNQSIRNIHVSQDSQFETSFDDDEYAREFIDGLKDEQNNIDKILNFLVHYKENKKGPGRPSLKSKENNVLKVPDNVSESLKTITSINDIHPGVLLDYLMKVNSLNKKILKHCDNLTKQYTKLHDKLNDTKTVTIQQPAPPPAVPTYTPENDRLVEDSISKNDELNQKIDSLEQRLLNDTLICNGEFVNSILDRDNITQLTETFTEKVKLILPNVDNGHFSRVTPIGKDNKTLKVVCCNTSTRNEILRVIRQRKPQNIYFSEFLTPNRNNLYYKLRQIKKKFPHRIASVYTRDGNLFFKIIGDNNYYSIKHEKDITDLDKRFSI